MIDGGASGRSEPMFGDGELLGSIGVKPSKGASNRVAPYTNGKPSLVSPPTSAAKRRIPVPQLRQIPSSLSWVNFKMRVFGIGKGVLGMPDSQMIHPDSPFARALTVFMMIFLLYTALAVPVMIGFFWSADACYRFPTLEFDILVDSFFIFQIIVTFVIGVYKKGEYNDSYGTVAGIYLRGSFLFDVVTSIPVSYIDFYMLTTECSLEITSKDEANMRGLKFLRILKPLRIVKMLRILKVIKFVHIFDIIEDLFRPPPLVFRVVKVLISIAFVCHFFACTYWLVKEATFGQDEAYNFAAERGATDPHSTLQRWIVAWYFVNTVFTTVGFGDISAQNPEEMVFTVCMMYTGTIIFGILLSEVESAWSSMRAFTREKGRLLQEMMTFMSHKDIESKTQREICDWVAFSKDCEHEKMGYERALSMVPAELRKALVGQMCHDELMRVPLFGNIDHPSLHRLLVDLWDRMEMETFYHGLPIAAARNDDADRMHLIVQGRVRVVVSDPGTGPRETVSILTPGDFFGENALLGDRMWGSELGMPADYFADTLVMCRTLTRSALEELLGQYEEDLAEEFALAAECQGERGDQLTSASDAGDHDAVRPVVLARWTAIVRKMKRADNIQKIGLGGDEGRFLKRAALRIAAQEPRHWARRGSLRGQAGIPSAKSPHVPTPLTGNVKGGHGAHLDLDSDWGRSASGGSREGANSTSHSPGYPPTGSWGTQAGGTQAGDTQAERFRSLGRQAASRGGSQRSFHSRRGSQTSFADLPNGSNGDHSRLQPGKASHRKSDADALLVAAGEDGARALQEMRAILEMQARQLKEQGQILKMLVEHVTRNRSDSIASITSETSLSPAEALAATAALAAEGGGSEAAAAVIAAAGNVV